VVVVGVGGDGRRWWGGAAMAAVVRRTPARWRGSLGRGEAALGAGMDARGGYL
jgi:hypothetical protein